MINRSFQRTDLRWLGVFTALLLLAAVQPAWSAEPNAQTQVQVKVVEGGESKAPPAECRAVLVGKGVNQPDPFPGYSGFVGWESPIRLKNGVWLVGFNAGYWHASAPTPLRYSPETIASYRKMGMPDIDAPTGGRAMVIRSTDEGKTWSKPETMIDTPADDRHPAFIEMDNGDILCSYFSYWGPADNSDFGKDPSKTVRVHFIRSTDGGQTWDPKPQTLQTPFLYDETDGPFARLHDNSILVPINGKLQDQAFDLAAVLRTTDQGKNWELLSTIKADHALFEVTVAELPDHQLVLMARPEGIICWSQDGGRTWTKPVTFGMRMFAPSLTVLKDGTLLCLHGSYAPGHGGLRAIFSTDGGHTWIAPAKDHGFLVDSSYGYGKPMELPDGSLFVCYIATGGHATQDAKQNEIHCIRMRVRPDHSGIDLLPAPNRP